MHIEITPENLLIQLGYQPTPALLKQMESIMENTRNFDAFSKHILSLKDELQHFGGYIAMSNSSNYLKIKSDHSKAEDIAAFEEVLQKWSSKYKVALQKVEGKPTYYILGQQ